MTGALDYGVWWLTNRTPPVVSLAGPPDVVRGQVAVGVQLAPLGRAAVVDAQVDGNRLQPGEPLVVDTASLPDCDHELVVTAEDTSWWRNRGSGRLSIRSDNTPPQLTLESRPERVAQGSTWLLRVRSNEPAAIEAWLGGRPLAIQADDGFGWAVVGFGPDAPPTALPAVVDGTDAVGNRA